MALREIRVIGDPILNKNCREITAVTPRIRTLAEDMIETMRSAYGVGLAGPQVGILKRIVVIEVEEGKPFTLINPKIREADGEQTGYEGCLSVPGKSGVVTRPNHVVCDYFDLDMKPCTIEGEGLLARCICHELDHLDGGLYVDKVEGDLVDNKDLQDADEEDYEDEEEEE